MLIITLVTIFHILACLVLILVVLLQSGKAADLAGAFGGMGSQTAFGPRGSQTVLSKATTVCAIIFMLTSLALSVVGSKSKGPASALGTTKSRPTQPQNKPATPPPAAPGSQQIPIPIQPAPPK